VGAGGTIEGFEETNRGRKEEEKKGRDSRPASR